MNSSDCQVFISYNTKTQQASADALAGPLRKDGYNVFVCADTIQSGETWRDEINKALASSVAFIALINDAYSKSKECMMELNFALGLSNKAKPEKQPTMFQKAFFMRPQPSVQIQVIPVVFKGFNPESNPSILNVMCNLNGLQHDSTLLTLGSNTTLRQLLDTTRQIIEGKKNVPKFGGNDESESGFEIGGRSISSDFSCHSLDSLTISEASMSGMSSFLNYLYISKFNIVPTT